MNISNSDKRIAVMFVLNGIITGNDDFTLFRIQRAMKLAFPAVKLTNLKLMSVVEQDPHETSNES